MNLQDSLFHPGLWFIGLALLLPFFRFRGWRWFVLVPPCVSLVLWGLLSPSHDWILPYLGEGLDLIEVDKLSRLFVGVFAIQALISALFALHNRERAYHTAAAYTAGGAFGMILAGDYWTLFMFWGVMTVASVFLIWLMRTPETNAAGFRYLVIQLLGNIFFLAGMLMRYRAVGSYAIEPMGSALLQHYDWLIFVGILMKSAVFPLHGWVPGIYPESKVAGGVYLAAYMTTTGVYLLIRCFPGTTALIVLGAVTALWSVVYACREDNLRRIASYLLVSQVGVMLIGIGIGTPLAINGTIALAFAQVFFFGLLFMASGNWLHSRGIEGLSRLGEIPRSPGWALVMAGWMAAALSMACVPFLSGFTSTLMILQAAADTGQWIAVAVLLLAMAGAFFAAGVRVPYFALRASSNVDDTPDAHVVPRLRYLAMAIAVALCIAPGVAPGLFYKFLPSPVDYVPYTFMKVIVVLIVLGLAAVAFFVFRKWSIPKPVRRKDFDAVYNLFGRVFYRLVCIPVAWADAGWSEVYRLWGVRGLRGAASVADDVDRKSIDSLVDGAAHGVRGLGRITAQIHTGRMQELLAWAVVLAAILFALFWFLL